MNAVRFNKLMAKLGSVYILLCILIANSGLVQTVRAVPEDVMHISVNSGDREANQISNHPPQVQLMDTSTVQNPQWKILVLIYSTTDFTYSDGLGQHHVVASMTQSEIDRAIAASNKFVNIDIPALTSGNMIPLITIREPSHPLSSLDAACGYWPNRSNISADLDPAFDSVIVIWDDTGTDLNTGQPADLNGCGGLAISNGTGQTHSTFPIDSVASNQRNVFKHEWGHSILAYFEAAGLSPQPTVDNHINDTTTQYVHCSSGTPYILQDETDDDPIPNSIYNNESGFTHDYYSGTTAKPENPNQCLGITATAWSYGGPVTQPITSYPNLLMNGGFEEGISSPSWWLTDAWTAPNSMFIWDTSKVHSGSRSIEIANSYNNDARWIQTVSVQPNADYRLSGWIKTQIVAHTPDSIDAGANLSVMGGFEHTDGLFGTNDWTYVSLVFNTGSRTQIDIAARLGMYSGTTTGIAWFDDLKLELLSAPQCYTLNKTASPAGNVSANPAPNCNNGTQYVHGTVIKLTANPAAGYTFSNWSGDSSGATNPTYMTMTGNKSVTANFAQAESETFGDVSFDHWAWNFIERLYTAGITGGCGVNPLQYCPDGTVTRAQMAVFLERGMHGSSYTPPVVGGSTGFTDVPLDYWSGAWIKQLAADGVTSGCGGGKYCPEASVTRAQMAVFLLKAKYGSSYSPPSVGSGTGFGDVQPGYWSATWIKQLVAEGITAGCGNGHYCPEQPVTRAQMAVFLVRTFNLP